MTERTVFLFLTLLAMPPLSKGACPDGYVDVNGQCYIFSEEELTYNEAVSACDSHDGQLVMLDDMETKYYIHSYSDQPCTYWIHPCSEVVDPDEGEQVHKYICEPKSEICVETFEGGSEDEPCTFESGQCQSAQLPCFGMTVAGECGDQDKVCCLPPDPSFPWRTDDARCGPEHPASGANPGQCDPDSDFPCCSNLGWCGNTEDHCECEGCVDYREAADAGDNNGGGVDEESPTVTRPLVSILPRDDWSEDDPTNTTPLQLPVPEVILHHTASCCCKCRDSCVKELRRIQNVHMNVNGWADIGYNFLVGGDGSVYEGRGWGNQGAHTRGHNHQSIGICFFGNYMNKEPTSESLLAVRDLIQQGIDKGKIVKKFHVYGHRDLAATVCPGDNIYKRIKAWRDAIQPGGGWGG